MGRRRYATPKPPGRGQVFRRRILLLGGIGLVALAALVVVTSRQITPLPQAQDPGAAQADVPTYEGRLASHLTEIGARFYGTYWCRFCRKQKDLFGAAAAALPYIECDPRSPVGQPQLCIRAGVQSFPTWQIGDRLYEGVLSLEDLARLSGFPPLRGD